MSHKAKAIVIICMDFRFQGVIRDYLVSQGLDKNYDLVSLAGAAKTIASPDRAAEKEIVLDQIKLSKELHHISQVILINHQDCGAYGPEVSQSPREFEIHKKDLKKAKKEVLKYVPGVKVKLLFLKLKGKFIRIK